MISDNYVAGDNAYLKELYNFFFDVLGMMSITHYGAIGDGRTDNYGALQVAIDDANRRGISFLYVPFGRFVYTGVLRNIGGIIFVGNPHAKIVNLRTGTEIEIKQFGMPGVDVSNYYTKDEVDSLLSTTLEDYYTKNASNSRYYTKTSTDLLLANKQDKLVAGDNIVINGNVISAVDQAFFACPFPTSWSGTDTSRTGTNDYGTWTITTDTTAYDSHNVGQAFDGSLTSYYALSDGVTVEDKYLMLELPAGASIRPNKIAIAYNKIDYYESPAVFQGYNASTSAWETLYTFDTDGAGSGVWTVQPDIETDHYFTKFRIYNIHALRGYLQGFLYELQITSGYLKEG